MNSTNSSNWRLRFQIRINFRLKNTILTPLRTLFWPCPRQTKLYKIKHTWRGRAIHSKPLIEIEKPLENTESTTLLLSLFLRGLSAAIPHGKILYTITLLQRWHQYEIVNYVVVSMKWQNPNRVHQGQYHSFVDSSKIPWLIYQRFPENVQSFMVNV